MNWEEQSRADKRQDGNKFKGTANEMEMFQICISISIVFLYGGPFGVGKYASMLHARISPYYIKL